MVLQRLLHLNGERLSLLMLGFQRLFKLFQPQALVGVQQRIEKCLAIGEVRCGELLFKGPFGLLQALAFPRFLLLEREPLTFQRHAVMMHLLPAVERHWGDVSWVLYRRQRLEQRLDLRELLLNLLMLFLLLLPALGIRFTGGQPLALFAWLRRGKAESGERLGQRGGTLSEFIAQLGLLGAKLANLRVERQAHDLVDQPRAVGGGELLAQALLELGREVGLNGPDNGIDVLHAQSMPSARAGRQPLTEENCGLVVAGLRHRVEAAEGVLEGDVSD